VRPSFEKDVWLRLLAGVAAAKVLLALAVSQSGLASQPVAQRVPAEEATALPPWVLLLGMLVIAAVGGFLLVTGRKDGRASYLGLFFLLLSSVFSNRPLAILVEHGSLLWGGLALLLSNLEVDGFAPYFFWLFTREFPTGLFTSKAQRLVRLGVRATLLFGLGFIATQLGRLGFALYRALPAAASLSPAAVAPTKPSYGFYAPFAVAMVAAFAALAWGGGHV
jgi:hypothetical protein